MADEFEAEAAIRSCNYIDWHFGLDVRNFDLILVVLLYLYYPGYPPYAVYVSGNLEIAPTFV